MSSKTLENKNMKGGEKEMNEMYDIEEIDVTEKRLKITCRICGKESIQNTRDQANHNMKLHFDKHLKQNLLSTEKDDN